jgi:hypothetical protein
MRFTLIIEPDIIYLQVNDNKNCLYLYINIWEDVMDFIREIGVDLQELDDALEIVRDKRIKEQDFIERLALTLNRMLDSSKED